ncbi:phosphatidylinositol glycan anchor biosynthesis class U [Nomia melanderi]|uniref:phosphatidylinositol glycan anchor biosynthesis class U n=1 Tax=Nomia melanderi TaxID=2448451 RepID=UPI0013043120|nr:phosphatidylinositol glycan anchor biosynthesis class U protein [Nomia melanderi]XP_031826622.1 phosphatidylinositol glycan anchor biosynthesis class U protein [Nomia melanderi]XP_031826631.1 phosphatidylinositol glycan anchor biosynthesis class U protein [Nomia melanderi]
MSKQWMSNFILAGTIRYLLMNSGYQKVISDCVEVSTALNSWKRVTEGVHLYNFGVDPYIGDLFHETPIGLYVFDIILQYLPQWSLFFLFIFTDLLTALLLSFTAKQYAVELASRNEQEKTPDQCTENQNDSSTISTSMMYVSAAYLFNPYIILNCVGHTTTVFTNLLCSIALISMTKYSIFWSCLSISLLTLQGLYPISLMVPATIYIVQSKNTVHRKNIIISIIVVFASILTILFCISYYIMGSWSFIWSTTGFILTVPDLRPNIGLYWYFFTEMFEHFRWLFIASFQINVGLLYIVPLALRLRHDPMLLAFSYLAIAAIFKSYPCIGDVGFYISLLPLWKHLFQYTQQRFVVGCFMLFCTVFAPTVWYQWIYSRSANANFYFGVTLAFAIAQIFLLTDILFASVKHEFAIRHGINKDVTGSKAKLLLE